MVQKAAKLSAKIFADRDQHLRSRMCVVLIVEWAFGSTLGRCVLVLPVNGDKGAPREAFQQGRCTLRTTRDTRVSTFVNQLFRSPASTRPLEEQDAACLKEVRMHGYNMNTTTTTTAGNHAHTNRDANALSVSTLTQSLHHRAKKRGGEIQFGSISASSAHFLWLMREERYAP